MAGDKTKAFAGCVLLNEARSAKKRSIVICGTTRGGTTFAASLFAQLGVPFKRNRFDAVSRRYEHTPLRFAFEGRDAARLREIVEQFETIHSVWAWKYPLVHTDFAFVESNVPNPFFVFIFKEPLSVAYRKWQVHEKDVPGLLASALRDYTTMVEFVRATKRPCLLISYDKAMLDLPAAAAACARFAGVQEVDEAALRKGVAADGRAYLRKLRIRG